MNFLFSTNAAASSSSLPHERTSHAPPIRPQTQTSRTPPRPSPVRGHSGTTTASPRPSANPRRRTSHSPFPAIPLSRAYVPIRSTRTRRAEPPQSQTRSSHRSPSPSPPSAAAPVLSRDPRPASTRSPPAQTPYHSLAPLLLPRPSPLESP